MANGVNTHHGLTDPWLFHVSGSPSASASSSGTRQQSSGHKPSKINYSATERPRKPGLPCSTMISPLEEVNDVVLASEYQCLSAPWPQPWNRTQGFHDYVVPKSQTQKSRAIGKRHLGASLSTGSLKQASWEGRDDRLVIPPMTPYIGRLESPELEPMKCSGRFCDCCLDEENYFEERKKMDHQSRCSLSWWVGLLSSWLVLR